MRAIRSYSMEHAEQMQGIELLHLSTVYCVVQILTKSSVYYLKTRAEGTEFALLTHAYITDSRLAGGSAPGPLAASQH